MRREHIRDTLDRIKTRLDNAMARLDEIEDLIGKPRDEPEPHEHKPPRHGPDIHLRGDP